MSVAPTSPPGTDPRLWHAVWFAATVAAGAVLTLVLGGLPGSIYTAFAAAAAPGALGLLLSGRTQMAVWAAGLALAVSAAGGLSGPGTPWGLVLVAAAAMLGRPFREAGILGLLGLAVVGAAEMAAVSPTGPDGWVRGLTTVAALATTGWALTSTLGARAARGVRTPGDGEPVESAAHEGSAGDVIPDEDTADLRRRLEEAEAGRAEAVAANAAKSRFLANMSHELRTPLNAIMGFADIMRNRLFGPLPDRYQEYSQLIHESGQHLLDLINDVLDMAKIEADRYRLAREVFDAREALTAVMRLMRPQAEEAGVDLRAVLPDEALTVDADKRALKQIALNLMSNALKFTPQGGSVTVTLGVVEEALELTVADTGVGVAAEDLERLGRPFEQAGGPESRAQGTGLGLSLVRAFAGLHGGEMSIESALGEGTAVTVRMPVLAPDGAAEPQPGGQVIPFAR